MKLRNSLTVAALGSMLIFSESTHSAEVCEAGQRRLNDGEPCIPEVLFNYLYCLSKSGGGKVEIATKTDSSGTKAREISVGGKGSGVVVAGEGNLAVKQQDASRAVREISERIDPSLASKCESLARGPQQTTPPSPKLKESTVSVQKLPPVQKPPSVQKPPASNTNLDTLSIETTKLAPFFKGEYCSTIHGRRSYVGCEYSTLESCEKSMFGGCIPKPKETYCFAKQDSNGSTPKINCFVTRAYCDERYKLSHDVRETYRRTEQMSPGCITVSLAR